MAFKKPECCKGCRHFEWDTYDSDGYGPVYYYCRLNIFLPTKKQTCKKQELYKKPMILIKGRI